MSKFVSVKTSDGSMVCLNIEKIIAISEFDGFCRVFTEGIQKVYQGNDDLYFNIDGSLDHVKSILGID